MPWLLTEHFEQHRPHLLAVARRILGSVDEAEDAVQESWLRTRDEDPADIRSVPAWLTTVVGRVCLNRLRFRRARPEVLTDFQVPDPVVVLTAPGDAEGEALLGDSVGLAMLVVLDDLSPPERVAFVLHDVFAVPFCDIAAILDRSEAAAQQLASRARRRVAGAPEPDSDLIRQRTAVDAFFAAARDGDFAALLDLLAPGAELRIDGGARRAEASRLVRGATAVAGHTAIYSGLYPHLRRALVNGAAGVVVVPSGHLFAVMAFTVTDGRIARIDALLDPDRLAALERRVLRREGEGW
jgi:RNA polymerase sigma factor (sigma-70 family)